MHTTHKHVSTHNLLPPVSGLLYGEKNTSLLCQLLSSVLKAIVHCLPQIPVNAQEMVVLN